MNRVEALELLPENYSLALRLRDARFDEQALANLLEIPVESVGPLLHLAEAKLAGLMESDGGGEKHPTPSGEGSPPIANDPAAEPN